MGDDGARQAINLDHERRLLDLEAQFGRHGRVSALEEITTRYTPVIDELALAQRVTEGVKRELHGQTTASLTRLQRWSIIAAVVASIGGFGVAIAQLWMA